MACTVRPATARDIDRAGDVNFQAFQHVALTHGQIPTVTTPGDSRGYLKHLLTFDGLGGLVAEVDGEVMGVAWVHPRGPVATIGPIAVDPAAQGQGIGRQLLERSLAIAGSGVPQVRLVHESFNARSLGIYLRAGFRVVAPLLDLERTPTVALEPSPPASNMALRAATTADRARLTARDGRAFGAPRPQSVDLYIERGVVQVAERGSQLAGYAFGIGFKRIAYLGAASADDPDTLLALATTVTATLHERGQTVRTLVPATDRRLVDGLLAAGFRVARACHYMVRGGGTAPPANYVLMNGDMM